MINKIKIQFAKKTSDSTLKAIGQFDKFAVKKRMQTKRAKEIKDRESNREVSDLKLCKIFINFIQLQQDKDYTQVIKEKLKEMKDDISLMRQKYNQTVEERKELMSSVNTTITVENLPHHANEDMIRDLFAKFPGITGVFINDATHVAIIEYETNQQAKDAREGMILISALNFTILICSFVFHSSLLTYTIGLNGFPIARNLKLVIEFK